MSDQSVNTADVLSKLHNQQQRIKDAKKPYLFVTAFDAALKLPKYFITIDKYSTDAGGYTCRGFIVASKDKLENIIASYDTMIAAIKPTQIMELVFPPSSVAFVVNLSKKAVPTP